MKGQQLLRDPNLVPNEDMIAQGLGGANKAFVMFLEQFKQYGITLMDWRYYNDGKAWLSKGEYKRTTPRGANKVTPIFWLSIWEGFFKLSFFFGESARGDLLSLPISQSVKESIGSVGSRFLAVIIDIENESQLKDVYELAQFKKIKG